MEILEKHAAARRAFGEQITHFVDSKNTAPNEDKLNFTILTYWIRVNLAKNDYFCDHIKPL